MKLISRILTRQGYPLKVYHAIFTESDQLQPLSHFGTRHLIQKKFQATSAPKAIPDSSSVQKNQPVIRIIPAYLHLQNPLPVPAFMQTPADYERFFVSCFMEKTTNTVALPPAPRADLTTSFLSAYQFIFCEPKSMSIDSVKQELSFETLYPQAEISQNTDAVNRSHLILQRLIRYWENQGYDGLIYQNNTSKNSTCTYTVFRPEQVVRLDRLYHSQLKHLSPKPVQEAELQQIHQQSLKVITQNLLSQSSFTQQLLTTLRSRYNA